jgi:hypothetical protein
MSVITLNEGAVQIGRYVDGNGELELLAHEDTNDAFPWKVTGTYRESEIAEEFRDAPHMYCYLAAVIEAWYDAQPEPPSAEATGTAATAFLDHVTGRAS